MNTVTKKYAVFQLLIGVLNVRFMYSQLTTIYTTLAGF
jgi:hypothetical protein